MMVHPLFHVSNENSLKTKASPLHSAILKHRGEHSKAFLLHVVKNICIEF